MDLLFTIPMGLLRAYGRMLPKLQAQESLLMAERLGVGTGAVSVPKQREIRRSWNAEANRGGGKRPRTKVAPEQLGAMGIGFKRVPKRT